LRFASSKTLWLLPLSAAAFAALAWSAEQTPSARTVPREVRDQIALQLGMTTRRPTTTSFDCYSWTKGHKATPCTAAESARLTRGFAVQQAAMRPPSLASLQVVSRLALARGEVARLVAWRTRSDRLCFYLSQTPGGGAGPFGPCRSRCAPLCIVSSGDGTDTRPVTYLLGGAVDARATGLRLDLRDGTAVTYALGGPLLGTSGDRAVLLALGRGDWTRLELLRGTTVLAGEQQLHTTP